MSARETEFLAKLDRDITREAEKATEPTGRDFAQPHHRLLFLREVQEARSNGYDYVCADCGSAVDPADDPESQLHDTDCPRYTEKAYR